MSEGPAVNTEGADPTAETGDADPAGAGDSGPATEAERDSPSGGAGGNRRLWTAAIFLSVAATGAAVQARGAVLPTLEAEFGAPAWQLGLVAPAGTVGHLLVVLAVGAGAGHVDTRRFILVGLGGSAVALAVAGLAPTFLVMLVAIFVRGSMSGFIRALDRPLLSHFYPENRGRAFNRYDTVWAVGAASGPLAVAAAIALGSWRLVYAALVVVVLAAAALFWRLDSPSVEGREEPLGRDQVGALLRTPEVLAMLAALFFVTGVEGGLFTWLPYYAASELPEGVAELTLTVMLVAYIPGRLACSVLAARVGSLPLVAGLVAGLVPAFVLTFVLAEGYAVLVGVAAIGLLIAGVFPTMVAYATDAVPEHSGPVNAVASATASVAIGAVPAAMGVVVGGSGAATAMALLTVLLVLALAVLVLAGVAKRRRAAREAQSTAVDD